MKNTIPELTIKPYFLLLLIVWVPLFLFAQSDVVTSLGSNYSFIESFSFLGPMAISPFWTLFITSAASCFGLGNEYIATNPVLGNWVVLFVSFVLVGITTLPNLMKVSKPIGLAAKFLENKAGYIVYAIIIISPYLINPEISGEMGVVSFGFLDIPATAFLMIALAIPYFIVVMTFRYFLEILIFLSPIPLLDAFFEFVKKTTSFLLVIIYFFFPTFGFVLSVFIFILSFIFYRKAKKVTKYFQYIYVKPIVARLFDKEQTLIASKVPSAVKKMLTNAAFCLKCVTRKKTGKLPSKSVCWFIKNDEDIFLCKTRFLQKPIIENLVTADDNKLTISHELHYYIIEDQQKTIKLNLNKNHSKLIKELAAILELEDLGKVGIAKMHEDLKEQGKKGIQKITQIFNSSQITSNKKSILSDE